MDVKKEIIEIVNKIESEDLLRLIFDIVKIAYNQSRNGKWGV